ncbi:hypothetical protein DICPUDRAFT_36779 [Dictyostelium purpureum]|uniref:Uncharacterized protein n=1 Tax=Dictyostelium purpureum TaxID=5786 RepID=F0ZRP7_DICPU|nr:uncharacterized protein DICPUDRAFT_36779 [Dictyostelium purpureum]EGC33379.1 hypothetical protein DICPUDRAFT_36779 [Dictyostelium purpureum]|eukprot:XP_003290087.1 hypothetical protein DICPUDRAFT_36779 [Dictyostelium purpureum]
MIKNHITILNNLKNINRFYTTNKSSYTVKGLNIKNRNELLNLTNEQLSNSLINLKNETDTLLKERPEILKDLSKFLNLNENTFKKSDNTISPFTLRCYLLAANQGITFYHHELRKHVTPYDDYERMKRKELVDKLSNDEINNSKKSGNKGISMEREMEIVREQQEEQKHFESEVAKSTQWSNGQLTIQPISDSFYQDDVFASFNPYEPIETNSQIFQVTNRLSKFYWREDITKWDMFIGSKMNQIIPQFQYHILENIFKNIDSSKGMEIASQQLKDSIQFILNEINIVDTELFKKLNSQLKESSIQQSFDFSKANNEVDFKKIINNSIIDGLIYMKSHHYRVTSDPFITFFNILKENIDYFSSLEKYKEFLEKLLDTILFETIVFDPNARLLEREYKVKLDILSREANRQFKVYYNYNTSPDPERFEESDLRKLSHLCKAVQKKNTTDFIQESKRNLSKEVLSNGIKSLLPFPNQQNPLSQINGTTLSVTQLLEGLYSCIPSTLALLDYSITNSSKENNLFNTSSGKLEGITSVDDIVDRFSKSKHISNRASLPKRFLDFIENELNVPSIYRLLIDLEEKIIDLTSQETISNQVSPLENWVGGMSIELEDNLEEDDAASFNIIPSNNFKLYKINNHLLSQLHKTFSEDIDLQIQDMEMTTRNKKIFEKQLKQFKDNISKLIIDSINSNEPTLYFIGIQDDQVYTMEIQNEWESIWNTLLNYPNGISLNEFLSIIYSNKKIDQSFFSTLTDLNKFGIVGLFPKF